MAQDVNKRRLFIIVFFGLIAIVGVSFWSGPAIEIPAFDFPKFDVPGLEAAKGWLAEIWPDNPIFPAKTEAPQVVQPAMQPQQPPRSVVVPTPAPTPSPIPQAQPSASIAKQPGSTPNANAAKPPAAVNKPVMPIGANVAGQTMRDVFAPPQEAVAAASSSAQSGPGGTGPGQGGVPTLTGVIQGGGSRVVILRFGAISRSYREGDMAGAFKVDSIGAYSVTLSGPNGNVVLSMGQ
jgi:hypothetical protein